MKQGLCLSGGGIKGVAHIGAIKALEEENIKFDAVSGTSSGSIVATMYAAGFSADEMYNFFNMYAKKVKYIDWKNIFKIIIGVITKRRLIINGFKSGEIISKVVNQACNKKGIYSINDIKKELLIPTVDFKTGRVFIFNSCKIETENNEEKYISNASIGTVVRASCSYPVIFAPCDYLDTKLLDGGVKENLPWKELKAINCNKIISIGFESAEKKQLSDNNLIEIVERSFELLNEELRRHELKGIDFLHLIKLEDVSLLEIDKMQEMYEEGYRQTKAKINKIKKYLEI